MINTHKKRSIVAYGGGSLFHDAAFEERECKDWKLARVKNGTQAVFIVTSKCPTLHLQMSIISNVHTDRNFIYL